MTGGKVGAAVVGLLVVMSVGRRLVGVVKVGLVVDEAVVLPLVGSVE